MNQAEIDKWLREDPSMIPFLLRDDPEIVAQDLNRLAWALSNDANCSRNDVLGLLQLLEN